MNNKLQKIKALKLLRLPDKVSSCEVKALKINNTVERNVN